MVSCSVRRGPASPKLSWEDTAREMAATEDWSAWDAVAADGLDEVPCEFARARRVSEQKLRYEAARRPPKR